MKFGFPSIQHDGPVFRASPQIRFFPFGSGGVLFLDGSRRIWALNGTSAYIWGLLDRPKGLPELCEALVERYRIDPERARLDLISLLATWRREGLLRSGEGDTPLGPERGAPRESPLPAASPRRDGRPTLPIGSKGRTVLEAARKVFEIRFADAGMAEDFSSLIGHLRSDHRRSDVCLSVTPGRKKGCWKIMRGGRQVRRNVPEDGVFPSLVTLVFAELSEALQEQLLFHAAALKGERGVVLFPGDGGSGKTTLAAALAARGREFYTDELAVLDPGSLRVTALPLPLSIKPGSVAALSRWYPQLGNLPVHVRVDGKRVRYLTPPQVLPNGREVQGRVAGLVFPRYRPEDKTELLPLDPVEALRRLSASGSSPRNLSCRDIAAVIALAGDCPSFELKFSDLEEALNLLEERVFLAASP